MADERRIVIIGAGITGLSCAYYLQQWGLAPLVLEASNHAGGVISTTRKNGFLFESGPQGPRFSERLRTLIGELNLDSEFVRGDPRAKRYILKDGQLQKAPLSPGSLLSTRVIGFKSKFRILSEPFRFSHPPASEETIASFVDRKFGQETLDYLVDPIVSAVFFGDVRRMGMGSASPALVRWEQQHGSVARGAFAARKAKAKMQRTAKSQVQTSDPSGSPLRVTDNLPSLGSFRRGMGTLIELLSKRLGQNIRFAAQAESLLPIRGNADSECSWKIRLSGGEEIFARHVVISTPAYEAARLVETSAPDLSSLLSAISYTPMAVVSSAFERAAVRHTLEGFGFMVPRREGLSSFCTIWNSSLFDGRAPKGMVVLTTFARAGEDGELLTLPDQVLAKTIEAETRKILGITGEPVERQVWKYTRALPQYNLGHAERITAIRREMGAFPTLQLAGNYLSGRSIGDCAEMGFRAAESIRDRFQR